MDSPTLHRDQFFSCRKESRHHRKQVNSVLFLSREIVCNSLLCIACQFQLATCPNWSLPEHCSPELQLSNKNTSTHTNTDANAIATIQIHKYKYINKSKWKWKWKHTNANTDTDTDTDTNATANTNTNTNTDTNTNTETNKGKTNDSYDVIYCLKGDDKRILNMICYRQGL